MEDSLSDKIENKRIACKEIVQIITEQSDHDRMAITLHRACGEKNNLEANKKNPKSTWKLINKLYSCNAGTFNSHFASVDETLASNIPPSVTEPDVYIVPAKAKFSMALPIVNAFYKKTEDIKKRKAGSLNKIPCKLLQIAAEIVAPSLT